MPRAFSSGAPSIWSYARNSPKYLVIAAVSVVLPWSTWPTVPMLTCGLVRSNFSFAILWAPHGLGGQRGPVHTPRATYWLGGEKSSALCVYSRLPGNAWLIFLAAFIDLRCGAKPAFIAALAFQIGLNFFRGIARQALQLFFARFGIAGAHDAAAREAFENGDLFNLFVQFGARRVIPDRKIDDQNRFWA